MLRGPVLAGTDFSEASQRAIEDAHAIAVSLGTGLIVCHVMPELLRVSPLFPQWRGVDATVADAIAGRARAAVHRQLNAVLGDGSADVRIVIDVGTPHAGLLIQADELNAGVIVVAPGDVATHVVRHAAVPVLVARPSGRGTVVGATDFSEASLGAVVEAASEARRRGTRLHLVHVLDEDLYAGGEAPEAALPYLEGTSAITLDGLERLRDVARRRLDDALATSDVEGTADVLSGHVANTIAEVAERDGAALVVVGTHGRSGLARVTLGSTAEAVVDTAPCSVLVVRRPGPSPIR